VDCFLQDTRIDEADKKYICILADGSLTRSLSKVILGKMERALGSYDIRRATTALRVKCAHAKGLLDKSAALHAELDTRV
jgi:hypothetical protein